MATYRSASKIRVAVAQLGARGHYLVPLAFQAEGMLGRFFTDGFINRSLADPLRRMTPRSLQGTVLSRWLGRQARLPAGKVTAFHLLGLRSWWAGRHSRSWSETTRMDIDTGRAFACRVAERLHNDTTAVYACATSSRELFAQARQRGIVTLLDQFNADPAFTHGLRGREQLRWPHWEHPQGREPLDRLRQRTDDERRLADVVICPSRMVVRSLGDSLSSAVRLEVVPLGLDVERFAVRQPRRPHGGPMRVLYAGGIQLLKGTPYLLEAARRMGLSAEFRLVGPINCRADTLAKHLPANVHVTGPVPRHEMPGQYAWADVFCFPTLCDSFGFAPLEAMASALPVVCTDSAGMAEHVRHGIDGFVIPPADPEALVESLTILADNPQQRVAFGEAAAQQARTLNVERWRRQLVSLLEELHADR